MDEEQPLEPAAPSGSGAAGPAYGRTLVLGLASATATAVGVSRPWASASATVPGFATIRAQVVGADLAPLAGALGVVVLAAFGAVIATRGWVRRCLGGLVVLCALAVLVAVVHPGNAAGAIEQGLSAKGWSGGGYRASTSPWRWVAGAGGLGCLLAGLLVARFGGSWATMSARYDAPASAADAQPRVDPAEQTEADLWRSIDRGHDPTQST